MEQQDGQNIDTEADVKIPIVRIKNQSRKYKIISFGFPVTIDGEVPQLYRFQYPPVASQPTDLHPGVIPAGFTAAVPVDDTMIYFHTREGMLGPEYQVCWTHPENVLLDWTNDVDALWIECLQSLEDQSREYANEITEMALDQLDADPLWLFGIADPSTQKALEKAANVPMLRCLGQRPVIDEWFNYLNADIDVDAPFTWIIESFAEVELPNPWTSYKGVGSVVCYLNNETNETTWKHPFYDYFAQLLDHCRRATQEEHIKLRINRMLWSYESASEADVANQQPLICPKFVQSLAEILEIDLVEEPYMVRTLKTFLKAFSQQYRYEQELEVQEIKYCIEIVDNERTKWAIAKELAGKNEVTQAICASNHQKIYCVEATDRDEEERPTDCELVAAVYCPDCNDCMCQDCFSRLHQRGNRMLHKPNHIIFCGLCREMPAKLQCTYTFGSYCAECYSKKHVKTLPKFLSLNPVPIDYASKAVKTTVLHAPIGPVAPERPRRVIATGEADAAQDVYEGFSFCAPMETQLGEKWHAFYDLSGIKYFYNFETLEIMRRPNYNMPKEVQDILLPPKDPTAAKKLSAVKSLTLSMEPRKLKNWTTTLVAT